MYNEPHVPYKKTDANSIPGWFEIIVGPMFSGKTEELIRRIRRAGYARQNVELYKPKIDTRYDEIEVVSHSKQSLSARPIKDIEENQLKERNRRKEKRQREKRSEFLVTAAVVARSFSFVM